jgi:hypothetical protein
MDLKKLIPYTETYTVYNTPSKIDFKALATLEYIVTFVSIHNALKGQLNVKQDYSKSGYHITPGTDREPPEIVKFSLFLMKYLDLVHKSHVFEAFS